ncbi:MAG: ECF transporter S component, partial [Candidatus Geothermarchaeales archaeon]
MWRSSIAMEKMSRSLFIALSAIFTGFVFVATSAFTLYIPQTKGFFNIGESAVYLSALIGGPFVGAIAGGFGSMLADLFLGFPYYAPATLVIKAFEGFIVGYLSLKMFQWKFFPSRALGVGTSLFLGTILFVLGATFYTGDVEIWSREFLIFTYPLTANLALLVWGLVSIVFMVLVLYLVVRNPREINLVISMAIGGIEMVLGYFLYEQFFYELIT